jgi:plastocyanin
VLVCARALMQGEAHFVFVDDSGFSPSELTIQAGDTVQWENVDESDFPHTTSSMLDLLDPDYWDGYMPGTGDTFPKTFNNPGEFHYYDKVDSGMGTIKVTSAVAPVINLESPRLVGGQFLFDVTGLTVGKTNVLLASTNLTAWTAVSTNVTDSATVTFTNAVTSGRSYFRVLELE